MDVRIQCRTCKKYFPRALGRVHEAQKMGWRPYCSPACQFRDRTLGKTLSCSRPGCTNTFYRHRKEIEKVGKSYCSRSCAVIVNNHNAPRRIRTTKMCAGPSCKQIISVASTYCSRTCFKKAQTRYTAAELIKSIKIAHKRLQRTPAKREMSSIADMCVREFGSWNNALKKIGLMPNRSHSQRMYKRVNTVAFDGHKCDSISEATIDNWLTKHNIMRRIPTPTIKPTGAFKTMFLLNTSAWQKIALDTIDQFEKKGTYVGEAISL